VRRGRRSRAREKEGGGRLAGRAEEQARLADRRRVPHDAVAGALREPSNPVGLQAAGFHTYAARVVIDFDHGAFAKQALDAAVQVSKIIHAARMPRAWERGTRIQLCQDNSQRKSPPTLVSGLQYP